MRSVQTMTTFPLEAVKPLERLAAYRARCLEATRAALAQAGPRPVRSPLDGGPLAPWASVEGLPYVRDPATDSWFLAARPSAARWAALLREVSAARNAPDGVHTRLAPTRTEHIARAKAEWVREALRLQRLPRPRLLCPVVPPERVTGLLAESAPEAELLVVDEPALTQGQAPRGIAPATAALLFESLDRAWDPAQLLRTVAGMLAPGGLLFVTALVSSGFDLAVLGARNQYLYPPDRANCFSRTGLERVITQAGFSLIEVSTPGVLDVEVLRAHLRQDPALAVSPFERRLAEAGPETQGAFQAFLQQQGLSSFARALARRDA